MRDLATAKKLFGKSKVLGLKRKGNRVAVGLSCTECQKTAWISWDTLRIKKVQGEEIVGRCPGKCRGLSRRVKLENIVKAFPEVKITGIRWIYYKQSVPQVRVSCPGQFLGEVCGSTRWVWARWLQIEKNQGKKQLGMCLSCSRRGDGWKNKDGYTYVRYKGKTCFEHRLIMERYIGRKLKKSETVHHRNGRRSDNRIENLEIRFSGKHPRGLNVVDLIHTLESLPGIKVIVSPKTKAILAPEEKAA